VKSCRQARAREKRKNIRASKKEKSYTESSECEKRKKREKKLLISCKRKNPYLERKNPSK
jgi:hypothetical protein